MNYSRQFRKWFAHLVCCLYWHILPQFNWIDSNGVQFNSFTCHTFIYTDARDWFRCQSLEIHQSFGLLTSKYIPNKCDEFFNGKKRAKHCDESMKCSEPALIAYLSWRNYVHFCTFSSHSNRKVIIICLVVILSHYIDTAFDVIRSLIQRAISLLKTWIWLGIECVIFL